MPGGFSVGKKWHLRPLVSTQEHGSSDGGGTEPVAKVVERGVEGVTGVSIERERQLDGFVVEKVGERHPHEGDALTVDQRSCGRHEGSS